MEKSSQKIGILLSFSKIARNKQSLNRRKLAQFDQIGEKRFLIDHPFVYQSDITERLPETESTFLIFT
jgi:hypothetical protein